MGIVGVSGSGKSTLMSILGGLDRPHGPARSRVADTDLLKLSDRGLNRYRREQVGFVLAAERPQSGALSQRH